MYSILDGRLVAAELSSQLKANVASLQEKGIKPTLAILRVGERPDDISYEKGVLKSAANIGVDVKNVILPVDVTLEKLEESIKCLNEDETVHGILIFRPLPKHLPEDYVKTILNPKKDVDCFTSINMAKIFEGDKSGFYPCTPAAVLEILDFYKIDVTGKKVGIIGRSLVVGKPQAMMLLDRNATVTICHSKSNDLQKIAASCDILVAAVGRAKMINRDFIKQGAIVIDVGINMDGNGKLCGDVDFDDVAELTSMISPVPGGVGAVTNNVLLKQVLKAVYNIFSGDIKY